MAALKNHPGMWLRDDAAAAINALEDKYGVIVINSAGRTVAEQQDIIDRYDRGEPGIYMPYRPPEQSPHVRNGGAAVDVYNYTDDRAKLREFGFQWTYGLADPPHYDFTGWTPPAPPAPAPAPAPIPSEEDDMLALKIKLPNGTHYATLGDGCFAGLIESDDPEWVMRVFTAADRWTEVLDERRLQTLLHKANVDLDCYRPVGTGLEIRNAATGAWSRGGRWSATDAIRGALGKA